jgi:AhpD family alkylhydroperoxidase
MHPQTLDRSATHPFLDLDAETAPEASRPALRDAARHFGAVPSPLARMAVSPVTLAATDTFFGVWAQTSFTPLEREVVVMTVARINGCHWCIAMHTGLLRGMKADDGLIAALRDGGAIADPRLASLARFTQDVMAQRGEVDDDGIARFIGAGYGAAQALEVVVGVAVFTLTTYANRLTRAPLPGRG